MGRREVICVRKGKRGWCQAKIVIFGSDGGFWIYEVIAMRMLIGFMQPRTSSMIDG